ncbi:MAG TPA: hypothetical protein VF574_12060 [Allosphingosinicella sp.]|jgi:hypothetical protein
MAKQALQEPQINAVLQKQRGAGMAQHVGGEMGFYTGRLPERTKGSPDGLGRPILSMRAQERRGTLADRKFGEQSAQLIIDYKDAPLAPPFAADMQAAAFWIKVLRAKLHEFRYAQTC